MQERWKEKRRFFKRGLNWSSVGSTISTKSQFILKRKREPFHTPSCTISRRYWTRANVCSRRKTYVLKTRTCQYRCGWRTLWIEIQNISAAKIQKNSSGNSGRRSFEGLLPSEKRYRAASRRISISCRSISKSWYANGVSRSQFWVSTKDVMILIWSRS